jgi:hypothetical protein
MYGDGCVMRERCDGLKTLESVVFDSGAPFYLSNWNSEMRRSKYDELYSGNMSIVNNSFKPGESLTTVEQDYDKPVIFLYDTEETKTVIISSDGLESFVDKTSTPVLVPAKDIFDFCLAFKGTGEYLQRRITAQTRRFAEAKIFHGDDLGMAAQHFIKE